MNLLEKILKKKGPCLSTDLTKILVEQHGITKEAARQRVSRGCPDMHRLNGLPFAKNVKFVYLKKDYRSPFYWEALYRAFRETNSAYWYALASLQQRDGIVPYNHFLISCGAPLRQKKHISPENILERLEMHEIVTVKNLDGLGKCVILEEKNQCEWLIPHTQSRLIAEKILIRAVSEWAKNIGMVSYNLLKDRDQKELPIVSTTVWDIAGPSYLSALVDGRGNDEPKVKPGFFACDVLLGKKVSESGIEPFIKKCKTLRQLKKVGRCLQIFVADDFHVEAFKKAKEAGIMPATVENLFGKEISLALKGLIKVLDQAAKSITIEPEKFNMLFEQLGRIEGVAGNLRGALFEYFTAAIIPKIYPTIRVRINEKCKSPQGTAEADVIAELGNGEILFIECKGHQPSGSVEFEEVKKWLQKRIPRLKVYANNHPDWKNKKLRFELWTTGGFNEKSKEFLDRAKESTKSYIIDYRDADGVKKEVSKCDDKEMRNTYSKCFYEHPLKKLESN